MTTFSISSIGTISSCFKEKFGIPRQPGLVKSAPAQLILNQSFTRNSVSGLSGFSHIWLNFVFHETYQKPWKEMVRPPRLGGNEKVGVFASRSPFRPNGLGLSVVELSHIEQQGDRVVLHLLGCDLLDGTPIVDIKPYLPYADAIPDATGGFAPGFPDKAMQVHFSEGAREDCNQAQLRLQQDVLSVIEGVLRLDPRPSYKKGEVNKRIYSMKLFDFDLKWQYCENNQITVQELVFIDKK